MDDLSFPQVNEIEDELLLKFVLDMAQGIHKYASIAERYGFADEAVLRNFLDEHPAILNEIRRYRAAFASDAAVPDRVRLKAGLGAEALIPYITLRCKLPDTPIGQVIAGAEWLSKTAGTYGPPREASSGSGGGTGTQFNLQIVFSDSSKNIAISGRTSPTVGDGEIIDLAGD